MPITRQNVKHFKYGDNLIHDLGTGPFIYCVHGISHPRANGEEATVFYIGKTKSKHRIYTWWEGPNWHHKAWTLFCWRKELNNIIGRFKKNNITDQSDAETIQTFWKENIAPNISLSIADFTGRTKKFLDEAEVEAIHAFWTRYGEPPLLNSTVPGVNDVTPKVTGINWPLVFTYKQKSKKRVA